MMKVTQKKASYMHWMLLGKKYATEINVETGANQL